MEPQRKRRTLKNDLTIKGIGLHSGKQVTLRLIPAESGTGLVFIPNNSSNKKFRIGSIWVLNFSKCNFNHSSGKDSSE
ncbi:MAG: UDP-3-O-acyl-N-acetylglucosamine deacetylase [Leptospiraceae bacterium]|nr:UDP-3-O-acyl-N-acetylglucosamine deacetylase [Leptospiraceae bacterium]